MNGHPSSDGPHGDSFGVLSSLEMTRLEFDHVTTKSNGHFIWSHFYFEIRKFFLIIFLIFVETDKNFGVVENPL